MIRKTFTIILMLTMLILFSFSATFHMPSVDASYIGSTSTTTLFCAADSYVNASSPDTNYGNEQSLYVKASETDLTQSMIYVRYDLSSIPQNAYIVSANMKLLFSDFDNLYYGMMGGGDFIGAYYCSDNSWTELGITWNNRPEFDATATDIEGFGMFIYSDSYDSWNVTEDVTKSLPSRALTEVLKFRDKNDDYGFARYQSKEAATYLPLLEIEYTTDPVFEVQFESIQDPEATQYFSFLGSNKGFISMEDEMISVPDTSNVEHGTYPVEYDSGYNFVRWETTGGVTVSDYNSKSTMATVSGSGSLIAVGNAEKLEYYYDNGIPEWNHSLPAGQMYARQFDPQFSGQLLSVRYYFNNVSFPSQSTFRVHILNSDKEDLITPFEATPTSNGWFNVDLLTYDLSIVEGVDFCVALEFLTSEVLCICGTSAYDSNYRDYLWDGTFWDTTYDDLMIRATVLNDLPEIPETGPTPEPETEPEPSAEPEPESTEEQPEQETTSAEPEERLDAEESGLSFTISLEMLLIIIVAVVAVVVIGVVAYKLGKRSSQ